MAVVSQQSSRAGLVSAVAVFVTLFLGALVWGIYTNSQFVGAQNDLADIKAKYKQYVSDQQLKSKDDIAGLEAFIADDKAGEKKLGNNPTYLAAALQEIKDLARLIRGSEDVSSEKSVIDQGQKVIADAVEKGKSDSVHMDNNSLQSVIMTLGDALANQKKQTTAALKARDEAIASAEAATKDKDAALKQKDELVTKSATETQTAKQGTSTALTEYQDKITTVQKTQQDAQDAATKALQAKDAEIAQLKVTMGKQQTHIAQLIAKLQKYLVDVKNVMVQRDQVRVLRVQDDHTVYVNVGSNDMVSAGLTFEVYNKAEGIPKAKEGLSNEDLPEGKASLEIIHVGPNSSEARVVHLQPGMLISEGDLCVNIAYDRTIKPNFVVFGKFDMHFNGQWTDQDAEIIKSLVRRFGGAVGDKINIDTDFVVMGKEPEIEVLSKAELEDPLAVDRVEKEKAAYKAYEAVRDEAVTYHLPIMNQARFLYYTGYFNSAKR